MAISAVSSISAGPLARPFRAALVGAVEGKGRPASIARIGAIPSLAGREDADKAQKADETSSRDAKTALSLDPRGPQSILSPGSGALGRQAQGKLVDREADKREVRERLDELLAQKAALMGRQAQQKNQSSAEVVNELAQLKSRDSEVRAHEAAHMAAGGSYITGGATYTYQKGPDGAEYAVGGEVGIDTSPVPGKPEETAQKMRTVQAAALAPSDPSSADLAVAASAAEAEAAALAQVAQARVEEFAGRYKAEAARGGTQGSGGEASPDGKIQARSGREAERPTRDGLDMVA